MLKKENENDCIYSDEDEEYIGKSNSSLAYLILYIFISFLID